MDMLPAALGGYQPLVHSFDQIDLALNGASRIEAGCDRLPIGLGCILFVEQEPRSDI